MFSTLPQESRSIWKRIELLIAAIVLLIAVAIVGSFVLVPQVSMSIGVALIGVNLIAVASCGRRRLGRVWSGVILGLGIIFIGIGLMALSSLSVSVVTSDIDTGTGPPPVQSR